MALRVGEREGGMGVAVSGCMVGFSLSGGKSVNWDSSGVELKS